MAAASAGSGAVVDQAERAAQAIGEARSAQRPAGVDLGRSGAEGGARALFGRAADRQAARAIESNDGHEGAGAALSVLGRIPTELQAEREVESLATIDVSGAPGSGGADGAPGFAGVGSGAHGGSGGHAGPAEPGQDAGAIELSLETTDVENVARISASVRRADGAVEEVDITRTIAADGFIELFAVGGAGGDGGDGGRGGDGAHGADGRDATRFSSGSDGGPGGMGGRGGDGSSGARGGREPEVVGPAVHRLRPPSLIG